MSESPASQGSAETFSVSVSPGDYVFQRGDEGADVFIVEEGRVELLEVTGDESRRLRLLEVGDFFGEDALLDTRTRETSARAVDACRLLRLPPGVFGEVVKARPEVAMLMLRSLSRRQAATPPGEPLDARLVHTATRAHYALGQDVVVGRFDRATGFSPGVDLSNVDQKKSIHRQHAHIIRRDGAYYLTEDKPTRNGTFVNGVRVGPGVEVCLQDGDRLSFGLVELVFRST